MHSSKTVFLYVFEFVYSLDLGCSNSEQPVAACHPSHRPWVAHCACCMPWGQQVAQAPQDPHHAGSASRSLATMWAVWTPPQPWEPIHHFMSSARSPTSTALAPYCFCCTDSAHPCPITAAWAPQALPVAWSHLSAAELYGQQKPPTFLAMSLPSPSCCAALPQRPWLPQQQKQWESGSRVGAHRMQVNPLWTTSWTAPIKDVILSLS